MEWIEQSRRNSAMMLITPFIWIISTKIPPEMFVSIGISRTLKSRDAAGYHQSVSRVSSAAGRTMTTHNRLATRVARHGVNYFEPM